MMLEDVLNMLQGPAPLQALSDPDELRSLIVCMENLLELLKDNERRLYPEQAPKSGRSRRNERVIDFHEPERMLDRILHVFQRVRQPLTPAQLHGQYIKNVDTFLLELQCDELVESGDLVPLNAKRGDSKKYCLPPDVPSEPEQPVSPSARKPFTYLVLRGESVPVYSVSNQAIIGVDNDYNLVLNHDQSLAFRIGSEDGKKIHNWNADTGFAHLDQKWMEPVPPTEEP